MLKKTIPAAVLALMSGAASAQACTGTPLNPGAQVNIGQVVRDAAGGSVICLNAGTYNWTGGTDGVNEQQFFAITKSPPVTVRSTTGQTAIIPSLQVTRSRGLTFKNLSIGFFLIDEFESGAGQSTRDITLLDNLLTGQTVIDMGSTGNNANIVLRGNYISGYDALGAGSEGTVQVIANGSNPLSGPLGIRIEHNTFDGGWGTANRNCADAIQTDINTGGITIGPGNVFRNWRSPCNGVHSDVIQMVGGQCPTITGNFFFDNTVHIGHYDGGANCVVTHNVFNGGGIDEGGANHQAFQIGGIQGMLFAHNLIRNIPTSGIGTKFANSQNTNWIIENNVLVNAHIDASGDQPGCGANCIVRYNLRDSSSTLLTGATNTNNSVATPSFVGPLSNPSTPSTAWQGFRLSTGSPGKAAANDGKDQGPLFFNPAAPSNFQYN